MSGAPAHWHVYTLQHAWSPDPTFPLCELEPACAHAVPKTAFPTDGRTELAEHVLSWLRNWQARTVLLTVAQTDEQPSEPNVLTFDLDDAEFVATIRDSFPRIFAASRFVHFDLLYDPILRTPNRSLRVSAVPGDEQSCTKFDCVTESADSRS